MMSSKWAERSFSEYCFSRESNGQLKHRLSKMGEKDLNVWLTYVRESVLSPSTRRSGRSGAPGLSFFSGWSGMRGW